MPKVKTSRRKVTPGQKIWAWLLFDSPPEVPIIQRPKKGSGATTFSGNALRLAHGHPVKKQGYVINVNPECLEVVMTSTFGKRTEFPSPELENDWYPVAPATSTTREPLPATSDGNAAWIYLGAYAKVTHAEVEVLDDITPLSREQLELFRQIVAAKKTTNVGSTCRP